MKLKLPHGPFEAYLFDCDGTIAGLDAASLPGVEACSGGLELRVCRGAFLLVGWHAGDGDYRDAEREAWAEHAGG